MRVAVTGSSGLLASRLLPELAAQGHSVLRLRRPGASPSPDGVAWNPESGEVDAAALAGTEVVIHLAGESIASGRWNAARKQRIRDSRVLGTRGLSAALAALAAPPSTLICASAVGYYGDRGAETLEESAAPGRGFLAEVCQAWEEAAGAARAAGLRVVHLRFGVILSPRGGALARMLLPFKLGAGGRLGAGRQYLSWISLDDAAGAVLHALSRDSLAGPVNAVAPEALTNAEFTRGLARALHRPALLPMPAAAVKLIFGEMGQELLLASTRAVPARLAAGGYAFRHPTLEQALSSML